jgi:two-component system, cell cycle sensor histidine kinase and response regulator CckA
MAASVTAARMFPRRTPIAAPASRWYLSGLKEVSTSGVRLLLTALDRAKIDVRPIIDGLSASEDELRAPGGRVDWDVWVEIMERLEKRLGGPDALEQFALFSSAHPGMHQFQRVAQLISSPTALYRLNSRWGIPNQYRHVRSECVELAEGKLRVSISLPPSYRGSVAVFRASLGVLRGLPKIVGLPESEILSREISTHGVTAVLKPPPPRTLVSYARRLARRVRGLESMIEQLGEQELELEAKSAMLERRVAEQAIVGAALRVSEERWRALAENAPGIILLLSEDGVIQSANRAFHGAEPCALLGRRLGDVVATAEGAELDEAIASVRRDRSVRDVELHVASNGEETWYSCRLGPMNGPDGAVTLSAFLTDITVRLRAERALREREADLSRAQRLEALGRLAGGVAHDFNNILTVVSAGLELLLDRKNLDSEIRADLEEIRHAGERAAALTRQLLAFSRQQMIAPEVLPLDEVVAHVRGMLGRLLGEDVQLEVRSEDGLWPVKLDRAQVEQILMNLAVNARDAMPRGGSLTIETKNTVITTPTVFVGSTVEPGSYVELSVHDTGLGMDVRTTARIFEPFYSTKEQGRGTGLGLAIVRGIASQSGGHVTVASEVGRGTTFRLLFPRSREAPSSAPATDPTPPKGGSENILLVEDDPWIRDLARRILVELGYGVVDCASAAEGLRRADAESIDLLLTDVIMPEISGPELARLLVARQPGLAVLFMSGYAEDEIVHRGVVDPGVSLLPKPFGPDSLARAVRKQLDDHAISRRKSS